MHILVHSSMARRWSWLMHDEWITMDLCCGVMASWMWTTVIGLLRPTMAIACTLAYWH